jgi:hypothetical protein
LKVMRDGRRVTVEVSADGAGLVSHAGSALLAQAADLLSTIRSELDARLAELRPLLCEYERLLAAGAALGSDDDGNAGEHGAAPHPAAEATPRSRRASRPRTRTRARRGAAQHAILAALEHGAHTASELANVTALAAPNI